MIDFFRLVIENEFKLDTNWLYCLFVMAWTLITIEVAQLAVPMVKIGRGRLWFMYALRLWYPILIITYIGWGGLPLGIMFPISLTYAASLIAVNVISRRMNKVIESLFLQELDWLVDEYMSYNPSMQEQINFRLQIQRYKDKIEQ